MTSFVETDQGYVNLDRVIEVTVSYNLETRESDHVKRFVRFVLAHDKYGNPRIAFQIKCLSIAHAQRVAAHIMTAYGEGQRFIT